MATATATATANPKQDADIKVDSSEIDEEPKVVKPTPIIKKKLPVKIADVDTKVEDTADKPKIVKKVQVQATKKDTVKDTVKETVKETVKDTGSKKDEIDDVDENDDKEILLDASKLSKNKKYTSKKLDGNTSNEQFNDEDVDYRNVLLNYDFSKNKTPAKITKYEKALLIGKRAKQIEEGANPNVKVLPGQSAIEIAEEELRQRKIPLIIKRPLGNTFEYWRPRDMEVLMD